MIKLKNYGLTIVLGILFAGSITGQFFAGYNTYNDQLRQHGLPGLAGHADYLLNGHFVSSVAENMESEFLQMAVFVALTAFLYQKGSAESKKPKEERTPKDREEEQAEEAYSQEQHRRRGFAWVLYENSLSLTLVSLFLLFFLLHAWGSLHAINEENVWAGRPEIPFREIFFQPEFLFESFQNWQSEFFSIAAIVLLTIWLRQKGSAQSKKLFDPTWKTGDA